ncbi:putative ATP-dependent RNA helicase DHR1, partial [Linderina pennispora]
MGTNKSTKQKRFEKYVEKQVKKEQRAQLIEKLSQSTWKSDLMKSSKNLGRTKETKREKLQRAVLEEKLGMARSDPSVRLYVSERDADEVREMADQMAPLPTPDLTALPTLGEVNRRKKKRRNKKNKKIAETDSDADSDNDKDELEGRPAKRPREEDMAEKAEGGPIEVSTAEEKPKAEEKPVVAGSALAKTTTIVRRKRQKKGRLLSKLGLSKKAEESSEEEDNESDAGEEEEEEDSNMV